MYSVLNRHIEPLLASIAREGGLDQYKYLMDAFRRTDTTCDIQFQRTYRSYWQMGAVRAAGFGGRCCAVPPAAIMDHKRREEL